MWKETLKVRMWAWWNVPMLAWARPSVRELTLERAVVRIPLRRRTRNHLHTMYFGALCIGADVAGGIIAKRAIDESGRRLALIFGSLRAEFLRRAAGDVDFVCAQGSEIRALVARAIGSGERESMPVVIEAFADEDEQRICVARFELELSLRRKD